MPVEDYNLQAEIGQMDRLTQTQDSLDELIRIMYSSLSYLTRKAGFAQVNDQFPITQQIPNQDSPETFKANTQELVGDFLRKAKQLEYLITVLPTPPPTLPDGDKPADGSDPEFEELERELRQANEEYLDTLSVAERLHAELSESLRQTLDARATVTSPLP